MRLKPRSLKKYLKQFAKNYFLYIFSDCFDVLISKIISFKKSFWCIFMQKNILNRNSYYNLKHALQ